MPSRERPRDARAAILAALAEAPGRPRSVGEIQHRAGLHPGERTAAKRILRELVHQGLARREGKRFAVPAAPPPAGPGPAPHPGPPSPSERGVLGTLTRLPAGYGFVDRLDGGEDVFVPAAWAARALGGDLVRVEVVPGRGGRPAARSLEVVERRRRALLGTYHARGRDSFVVPVDRDFEGPVAVPETRLAADGDLVKVALEPGRGRLRGRVAERMGRPGEPRLEALRVAYSRGFSDLFSDEVAAEAEAVPDRVRPEDRSGRRDLTRLRLVTIDGEDARDFDDAVHVERLGSGRRSGWRLVVAIADVSHYVRPGSALDAEALRRGTSVYFPQLVLPMLPERLSNGICSLNPDAERLCLAADMRFDARGEIAGADLYPAVIRSAARCTYGEVARVLSGERVPHREFLRTDFEAMGELQEALSDMRRRRGAIDFDLPEARVVLGDDGAVLAIEKRPRNRAHRLVEEFMLAANESVARWFRARELPTIYRVHGLPDEEKLAAFLELARLHGFAAPEAPGPRDLNALLHRMGGHPQQRALNQLLLRAMMQAVYSPENIGHFGLAAEHYLHFTSPIRRYPDLVVHRLLRQAQRRGGLRQERTARAPDLGEVAALASERERAAMQSEREVQAFYAALFMRDKVGQRFRGVVASVAEFGLFVELGHWFVEGLVKAEDLGAGFQLDPALHALVERRSGRAFRVGDQVEVEVLAASPARRQIDLGLVEGGEVRRAAAGPGEERRGGGAGGRRAEPARRGRGRGRGRR